MTFEIALDIDPEDWGLRLIYADWLDEHDRPMLAVAQRWMAFNRRRPGAHETYTWHGRNRVASHLLYGWWRPSFLPNGVYTLPEDVFRWLPPPPLPLAWSPDWPDRKYPTRIDAEAALAAALQGTP